MTHAARIFWSGRVATAAFVSMICVPAMHGQNQTVVGAGNARAIAIARRSALVQSAYRFIVAQTNDLSNNNLRVETYDALANPETCIRHRAKLKPADKQAIVSELLAQGLLNVADNATFPGGLLAGVFPPVLDDPERRQALRRCVVGNGFRFAGAVFV